MLVLKAFTAIFSESLFTSLCVCFDRDVSYVALSKYTDARA